MRILRVILYMLGTLMGLVAIIVLLALNLDFGRFKPQVESLLSDVLQRPFVIDGPLHLTLGLEGGIELAAANVSLASSQWSAEPHLVSLRSLEVRVEFQSLLRRPIVIDQLLIDGLRVNLEQDGEGNNNWSLFGEQDSPMENEPEGERFQLPVLPVDIRLTDTALAYATPDRPQPLRVIAGTISEAVLADGGVRLSMDGKINETAMAVEISSPHFEALISMLDVELGLKGHLGKIVFDGKFAVADLQAPRRPTASLNLTGPNIGYLIDILKLEQVTAGPLNLAIDLAPKDENMLFNVQGVFGEFNVTASGSFPDLQQLEVFELETSAHGPDIGRIAGIFGVEHGPRDPFTLSGRVRRAGADMTVDNVAFTVGQARLTLDGEFADFPNPNDAQATVHLDVPDIGRFSRLLRIPGTLNGPLLFDASLATPTGSSETIVEATASSNEMNLRVDGNIVDATDFAGADVQVAFSGPTLQTITTAIGLDMAPDLPFEVSASLSRVPGGISIREALVDFGADQLTLRGKVANQPLVGDTDLSVELGGPSLAVTLEAFGIVSSALPLAPYRVSGRFQRVPEHFLVKDLVATLGQERATIEGVVGSDPMSADTRLVFDLASPDLRRALASFGIEVAHLPEGGLTANGTLQGGEGFVGLREVMVTYADTTAKISGQVTGSPSLDGTALQLELSGHNLAQLLPPNERLKRLAKPFSLDAAIRIEDTALVVEGADFQIDQTQFQLDGRLALNPLLEHGSVRLTGNSADILPLTSKLDEIAVSDRLPLKLQSQATWLHDRWSIKELDLLLGKARLTVDGALKGPPDFGDTNLQVHGTAPSLSSFNLLTLRELPDLPVDIQFSLIGDGDKILLQGFEAVIGKSDVRGDFSYRSADVPEVTAAFTSKQLNVTSFLPPTSDEEPAKTQAPKPGKKRERVIPDTPIPTDALRRFLAEISIDVNELTLDAHTLQDVELIVSVADGAVRIEKVGLKTPWGGRLDGALALLPSPGGATFHARVKGHSLKIGLPAKTEEQLRKLPRYELNLALNSEGSTVRELAGDANGYLRIESGQGQIKSGSIRLFTNDFMAQLVETLNPFEEKDADPYAQIRCATVLAAVEKGQVIGKPIFVLQTERLNIFANAKVNLRNEKLEVSFRTVPQKGLGVSMSNLINPFVKVTDTLAKPALSLDAESTVIRGGVAVATGGLSALAIGFNDRFLSPKDPCGHAFIEADEGQRTLEAKYGQGVVKN